MSLLSAINFASPKLKHGSLRIVSTWHNKALAAEKYFASCSSLSNKKQRIVGMRYVHKNTEKSEESSENGKSGHGTQSGRTISAGLADDLINEANAYQRVLKEGGGMEFERKQKRLGRPLSPHMTIYKPQITWTLSLLHRATGITSTAMLYALGIGYMFVPYSFPYYVEYVRSMHIPEAALMGVKFLLAWQVFYHMLNGFRHLVWDLAWGLETPKVTRSGIVVLTLSTVLAAWATYLA